MVASLRIKALFLRRNENEMNEMKGERRDDATNLVEESSFRLTAKVVIGSTVVAVDESLDEVRYTDDVENPKTML